jgi:hypothetical protein
MLDHAKFKELADKMYEIGNASGDLGFAYWHTVIKDVEELLLSHDKLTRDVKRLTWTLEEKD